MHRLVCEIVMRLAVLNFEGAKKEGVWGRGGGTVGLEVWEVETVIILVSTK